MDYRQLDSATSRPTYPIPEAIQLFDALGEANVFALLGLSHGYCMDYNVEFGESDKQKTAFTTRRGRFEFYRMPFGLCLAQATFQRIMNLILQKENWEQCLIYLDDVLIFGKSFEQHFDRLKSVLRKIEEGGEQLKPEKCKFLQYKVTYLGHGM